MNFNNQHYTVGKISSIFLMMLFLGGFNLVHAETNEEAATFVQNGNRLLDKGDLQGALSAYEAGWKASGSDECLKGLAAIYMKRQDLDGIKLYIEPITKRSENDLVFLQIALAYSMQIKDEKLFRTCLRNTKREWLESKPALQFGIASGAKMFFSDKHQGHETTR